MLVKLGEIYGNSDDVTAFEPVFSNDDGWCIFVRLRNQDIIRCTKQVKHELLYPSLKELADIVNNALQNQSYGNPGEEPAIPAK